MNTSERYFYIDFMRFIGLICIVLAHISPPSTIFWIRNFDVSLMVFVSGVSFSIAMEKTLWTNAEYLSYFKKRFRRLVFPVWFFLSIYFVLGSFFSSFTIKDIFLSYTLISGIGYVWFIRIILIFSVIGPLLIMLKKKYGYKVILLILILSLFFNDFFYGFYGANRLFDIVSFDWIGYLPIYLLGMYIFKFTNQRLVFLILLVSLFLFYNQSSLQDLQVYKYPPRGIYIFYGVFFSALLYYSRNVIQRLELYLGKLVRFTSYNSMWIYLFHIVFISSIPQDFGVWWGRFLIVLSLSYFCVKLKNIALIYINIKNEKTRWIAQCLKG